MAITEQHQSDAVSVDGDSETQTLILHDDDRVNDAVDYRGEPALRSKSGTLKSSCFIIALEVTERMAYFGIGSNLINFLTQRLHQNTAMAAANVNVWNGTSSLLPLLGAFIADSYLGRYRTILIASLLYILGVGLLTLSAVLPSLANSECNNIDGNNTFPPPQCSPISQSVLFFISLYLIAFGVAGHRPCVQAFGADQFDENHPKESIARSSFFNWWYFTMNAGMLLSFLTMSYIQDNLGWVLGFGIPCLLMIFGFSIFLLGTNTYRFTKIQKGHEETNIVRIEEAKALLVRLAPIWASSLVYGIVSAQVPTFTKQGTILNRTIFLHIVIPSASLHSVWTLGILIFTPIYDFIFVPIARAITKKPSGITMLQRIGTGVFLSIITVIIAALVEKKRLQTAQEYGVVDDPNAIIPMSVWWLIPQYLLIGISDVFALVGLQEFFYDQVPSELRSMGLALYLSILGVGNFLSGFLVSLIRKVTSSDDGETSWFADNLNQAHLDYFYWFLAGFSATGLASFILFAKSYLYSQTSKTVQGL